MALGLFWPFRATVDVVDNNEDDVDTTASLHHYSTPGRSPPSARVDPKRKLQERRPIRLWHLWKYGLVAASKATEITTDLLLHSIWGPRKKSWGVEMTIITSIMRGAGRHSALVDIASIRMLMSIGGLVPLPSDAIVTPVTFRVRRRQLRGILASFDSAESGRRELSGEWVVGRKTWQRLQSEWKATKSKSRAALKSEDVPSCKRTERVVLYIHGGAYYVSSAASQRLLSIPLAKYTDSRVFALDYRLAPETQFPGPLHDAVSGYFRLVDDLHIPPENIVLAGDSAGGGLVLALLLYLRDNKYPLPSSAILMSPWVDLTMSCQSWDTNAPFDVVPIPAPDDHMNPVAMYLGENMERYLTHPYASPLFGNFEGLPPLLIQSGDAEVLRDEITLLAHKASLAGVEVRHELYEDAIHVFQMYPFLTTATRSFMSMRSFVQKELPQLEGHSPHMLAPDAQKVLVEEIDNESVSIVRGDGVEVTSGKHEVEVELEENSRTDSDEDSPRSSAEEPSWGRSASWSLSGDSDESTDGPDDSSDEETEIEVPSTHTHTVKRHRSATLPSQPQGFRRIRSAISLIMPDPLPPAPSSQRHRHRRTRSQQHSPILSRRSSFFDLSKSISRDGPGPITLPPVPHISVMRSVPPSPSIRRSAPSHPDISSLVQTYSSSGPANETVFFSPT